jgi:hypothetical protein
MQGCGYLVQCEPNMHAIACEGSRIGENVNCISRHPGSLIVHGQKHLHQAEGNKFIDR